MANSFSKRGLDGFWAIGYMMIFLAIQIITQMLVLVAEKMCGNESGQLSILGTIITMVVFSLVTIFLFTGLKWAPVSKNYILTRPWGVVFWSVIASLGTIIPSLWLQNMMPEWPDAIQKYIDQTAATLSQLMSTPGGYAVVCLLAPVAEEVVFRGAVLHSLLKWKPQRQWLMILLSAILFALAHLNPAQALHPLLIGLLLGWMYVRTNSIVPGIVFHWANNTVAYLMYHAYPNPDVQLTDIFGQQSHVLMAVACSMLILLPAIYQLNQRMRRAS